MNESRRRRLEPPAAIKLSYQDHDVGEVEHAPNRASNFGCRLDAAEGRVRSMQVPILLYRVGILLPVLRRELGRANLRAIPRCHQDCCFDRRQASLSHGERRRRDYDPPSSREGHQRCHHGVPASCRTAVCKNSWCSARSPQHLPTHRRRKCTLGSGKSNPIRISSP